jgi:hypothetical protein
MYMAMVPGPVGMRAKKNPPEAAGFAFDQADGIVTIDAGAPRKLPATNARPRARRKPPEGRRSGRSRRRGTSSGP